MFWGPAMIWGFMSGLAPDTKRESVGFNGRSFTMSTSSIIQILCSKVALDAIASHILTWLDRKKSLPAF